MIFTSATRHCAPSAAEPGAVIRSTTCDGGIEGGMIGAGRGGACATKIDAIANGTATRSAPAASLTRFVVRIFAVLPVSYFMRKVCEIDSLICPKSQGEMWFDKLTTLRRLEGRIISFIDQPEVIKKFFNT